MRQIICFLLLILSACCREYGDYPAPCSDKSDSVDMHRQEQLLPFYANTDSLFTQGLYHCSTTRFDSARICFERALHLPGGRDWQGGRVITGIGTAYMAQGYYAEALTYYLKALEVSEKMAAKEKGTVFWAWGKRNSLRVMANVAEIHHIMGNINHALAYARRAESIMVEMNEYYGYSTDFDQITNCPSYVCIYPYIMYVIGATCLDKGEYQMAEDYLKRAFDMASIHAKKHINIGNGKYWYYAYAKEGMARVFLLRKEYGKAFEYINEALDFAEKLRDPQMIAKILTTFSDIYLAQEDYTNCERLALRVLESDPGYMKLNPELAYNITIMSLYKGKSEQVKKKIRSYSDQIKSIADKKFRETIAVMEVQFETQKKEQQIRSLQKERKLYLWLGAVGVMSAALLGLVLLLKVRNSQKEKQLVATKAVQEGEMKERERIAAELHDRLLGSLSALKSDLSSDDASRKLNESIKEIRRISRNLMPLPLRFGIKTALKDLTAEFSNVQFYFFGREKRIEKHLEFTLYCCASELITNSIHHSCATNINVQLVQGDSLISLTVQDNGTGFDEKTVTKGVGLRSIQDRVASCNGKIDIVSSPEKGTETTIELKY